MEFMDWALHQPEVRFDVRAERAEYERTSVYSDIQQGCFRIALFDSGAATEPKKFLLRTGNGCTRKKHKHEDYCIRRECWAGAMRRGTTLPTKSRS
jgi:hypothetical protein